jgi:hypothetical protein
VKKPRTVLIEITNCDDCLNKEYGLRKCALANRWFEDLDEDARNEFEPEKTIAPWCPLLTKEE